MADVPGNLGDEIKSSPSHGGECIEDANVKSESISEMGSSDQQRRETTVETIKPAGVEKSEGHASNYEQAEKPDDGKAAEIYVYNVEREAEIAVEKSADVAVEKSADVAVEKSADVAVEKSADVAVEKPANVAVEKSANVAVEKSANVAVEKSANVAVEKSADIAVEKSADIAVEKSADVAVEKSADVAVEKSAVVSSKCSLEASAGECALPEVLGNKGECVDAETVRDKEGALRRSPKTKGGRVKESPKRVSVLSDDGKATGCFCRISPKRILDLFRPRSSKFKSSPNRGAVFSPIGDGKHFEVLYLGRYSLGEHETVERIDYTNMAEEKIIPTFLGSRPCYDVMPTSGKVVVFSVELLVKNAFSALVSNEIKAAPLWDAGIMDFVGMLTITDFINVLKHYYVSKPEDMKDIENQSIATWRRMTGVPKKFSKINGQDSLAQAAKLLIQERIHRIPVFDEKRQCVLFVLTKKRLLQFLSQGLLEKFDKTNVRTPSFFKKTIRELKIGTFENIAVVYKETKVIDALSIFVERNVSALPVLDKDNILIDLFEKFDVFGLAKDQTYHNLEMTVDDVISKPYARETAWICTMDETLQTVIYKFVSKRVHRLVVIDARRGVAGMLSLSDVLKFLVVQPLGLMESASVSDTILEGTEGAVGGTEMEADCPVEVDVTSGIAHMKIESSETTDDTQEEEEPSADD